MYNQFPIDNDKISYIPRGAVPLSYLTARYWTKIFPGILQVLSQDTMHTDDQGGGGGSLKTWS